MLQSVFRRALSSGKRRPTILEIPYLEEQLMTKIKDRHFNQYGIKILNEEINLFSDLSVINVAYIINNDVLWRHRASPVQLELARNTINSTNNYKLIPKNLVLEKLFGTLYLSLHYYENRSYHHYDEIMKLIDFVIQDYHFSFYDTKIPDNLQLDDQTNFLVNLYYMNLEESTQIISSPLKKTVRQVLYILLRFIKDHDLPYSFDDLTSWLISLNAPSISQSADSLKGRSDVPLFVLKDIIYRQPRSAEDLELMVQLCFKHSHKLFELKSPEVIPSTLRNMIQGCLAYNTTKLRPLLNLILEEGVSGMEDESAIIFLNKLILFISETNVAAPRNQFFYKDLLNSQTHLISYLSKRLPEKGTIDFVTVEGFVGITTIFQLMGDQNAFSVLSIVENEYDKVLLNMINSENFTKFNNVSQFKNGYYATLDLQDLSANLLNLKLLLATSENTLVKEFTEIIKLNSENKILIKYPKLWASFAISMRKFSALTPKAAEALWKLYLQLVLNQFKDVKTLSVDSAFIKEIVIAFKSKHNVMMVFKTLQEKKYKLNNTVMIKFFAKLYHDVLYLRENENKQKPVKMYDELLSYVRALYKSLAPHPPSRISTMLIGESKINPQQLYNMYYSELKDLRKDDNSLRALCQALLYHYSINEEQLMWLYEDKIWKPSYEVCILEMNKNILKNEADRLGLFPTDRLWNNYIDLLSTFQLKDELIKIFHLWDDIDYTPSVTQIEKILANLDPVDATKILRHARMYLISEKPDEVKSEFEIEQQRKNAIPSNTRWPWPDEQEFANYKYIYDIERENREKDRQAIINGTPI